MFFERLTELCEEKNEKLTPTLKILKISTGSISNWKNGSLPAAEALIKLSKHFCVTTDYLLGLTDKKNNDLINAIPQFPDLINKYSALNKEGRQKVDVYINDLDERYKIKKIIHHTKKVVPAS